jgi:hypothetical protein
MEELASFKASRVNKHEREQEYEILLKEIDFVKKKIQEILATEILPHIERKHKGKFEDFDSMYQYFHFL